MERCTLLVIIAMTIVTSGAKTSKNSGLKETLVDSEITGDGQRDTGMVSIQGQVCASLPCLNGGSCVVTGADTYKCKCPPYFVGASCNIEPLRNVALGPCGANCTVSSTDEHPENPLQDQCYNAIDGDLSPPTHWATHDEREGAWYRVHFSDYFRIQSFGYFAYCSNDQPSAVTVKVTTSDDKSTNIELMCLGTTDCSDKFVQHFDLVPTISSYLNIEAIAMCEPQSPDPHYDIHDIMVYGNDVPLKNAASLADGATCTASSAYHQEDFGCQNAINEVDSPGVGNEWMSDGEGAGAWIQINLNQISTVMAVSFLQRCSQMTQNNFLMLEFSDLSTQEIELECFTTGQDPLDCDGQYWQQFDLDPYVVTSYVRVTITAVCAAENNGFREIRVFSLREEGNY